MSTLAQHDQKARWIEKNRGVFTRIAQSCGFTVTFVREIYWGTRRSKSGDVERLLTTAGAPGFKSDRSVAA